MLLPQTPKEHHPLSDRDRPSHGRQAIVDTLDTAKLWLYPQIFWAAIALLHTDFEQEFHQAIRLLTKIITRFKGFSDIAAQNVFLTYSPKGWDPPFEGVQKLVLRGILSAETLVSTVQVTQCLTFCCWAALLTT